MIATAHAALDLRMLDPETGQEVARCVGPRPDGACPRVDIGDVLPCAGCSLLPAGAAAAMSYAVPAQMTLCPVTLALAMAVSPETPLIDG